MAEVQTQPAGAGAPDEAESVETVRAVAPESLQPGAQGTRPVREEFWNLPNTITMFRISLVPLLLAVPFALGKTASAAFAWLYIVAAVTDIIDGWLARRGQMVTHIGKLLDPLADKLLVSTALIMLLTAGRLELWASWMVVVIIARELAVTGLRSIASAGGHIMPANWLGKVKAVCQNIAIAALLFHYPTFGLPAHEIGLATLFLATLITMWSGYKYFESYFSGLGTNPAADPANGEAE